MRVRVRTEYATMLRGDQEGREEELKQELSLLQQKYQEETQKGRMLQEKMIDAKRKRGGGQAKAKRGDGGAADDRERTRKHCVVCARGAARLFTAMPRGREKCKSKTYPFSENRIVFCFS